MDSDKRVWMDCCLAYKAAGVSEVAFTYYFNAYSGASERVELNVYPLSHFLDEPVRLYRKKAHPLVRQQITAFRQSHKKQVSNKNKNIE